jgi:hypothetical protein
MGENGCVIVVCVEGPLSDTACGIWTEALFEIIVCENVLILDTVKKASFIFPHNISEADMVPPLLRAVETTKARDVRYVQEEAMQSASSSSGKAKRLMKTHPVCPFMESPNLLRSLSAAIITHAEACAICANELSAESRGTTMMRRMRRMLD